MARPVVYLRKSKVTSDRHVSWDVQEAAVRELAAKHGDMDLLLLSDWSRSGRGEKTRLRQGYRQLKEMLAAGEISVVYSYSLSRLARSLPEYASLAELCRDKGVRIRLCKEGELDYSSPSGRFHVGILALLAQMEAELAQERAVDTARARRARGDYLGVAPYGKRLANGRLEQQPLEPVERVVAAYRQAGSFSGAARALNLAGVPTRYGSQWTITSVRRVLRRELGAVLPRVTQGAKARSPSRLFRLLLCPCGQVMTPHRERYKVAQYISYFCYKARTDAMHSRPWRVAETKLLPWLMAEAERLQTPELVRIGEETGGRRQALLERRDRVLENYEVHGDKVQRDAKLAAIADELEALDAEARLVEVPRIDWDSPPEELNRVLRSLWDYVRLDEQLRPVEAVWAVPGWRRP